MSVAGFDIGGANIKAAHLDGPSLSLPFDLWKAPEQLAARLAGLMNELPAAQTWAVTMTGELADCFATKAEGVQTILAAVREAAGSRAVAVWQTGGEFVDMETALEIPMLIAAANWHAAATWMGRLVPTATALWVDVGSTTTDIIPLLDGLPLPSGRTDLERLLSGELVYSGVRRTPLSAIAHSVPFREGYCPLAAELFATTLDVNLLLHHLADAAEDLQTANGRPATREAAYDRLARMLCCDRNEISLEEAEQIARFLFDVQRQRIAAACDRVCRTIERPCDTVLISGSGEFLARDVVEALPQLRSAERTSLNELLGREISETLGAVAVARLASERL